jgi:hypothetical protein
MFHIDVVSTNKKKQGEAETVGGSTTYFYLGARRDYHYSTSIFHGKLKYSI